MTPTIRLALPTLAAAALALVGCHRQAADTTALPPVGATAASGPVGPAPAGGWTEQVVETPAGGFRMGNPNAAVKLVEYGSRTCPHCGAFAKEAMPEIRKMVDGGKLSYEFRDFPIHAPDLAAILLGQCNGAQSFFPILESMFADQVNTLPRLEPGTLPVDFQSKLVGKTANQQAAAWADYLGYTRFVGQRGVPEAKAQACLADPAAVQVLSARLQKEGDRITGTPSFTINDGDVISLVEWPGLKAKLVAAGA